MRHCTLLAICAMAFAIYGLPLFASPTFLEEEVPTPSGMMPRGCLLNVHEGEEFQRNGDLVRFDGTVTHFGRCPYAPQHRSRDINGYLEAAITFDPVIKTSISAFFVVPQPPLKDDGQILFYFPALQPDDGGEISIVQPVLSYNNIIAGWSMASWDCCNTGYAAYSDPIPVKPGDLILGSVVGDHCDAAGCPHWAILSEDLTQGTHTILKTAVPDPHMTIAMAGALEVYGVTQCANFSKTPTVDFFDVVATGTNGAVLDLPLGKIISSTSPQCGYGVDIRPFGASLTANAETPN